MKKYEKEELYILSADIASQRESCDPEDVRLEEQDIELLDIAFSASAKAGVFSLSYIRGIFENWKAKGIKSPDEYWGSEAERDIESGKAFRGLEKNHKRKRRTSMLTNDKNISELTEAAKRFCEAVSADD